MRHRLLAAVLLGLVVGCSGSSPGGPVPGEALPTLPAGTLRDRVLQPGDVQVGLVPIAAQTGPAGVREIAGFSADPKAAERSLHAHGFADAYVVQYADPQSQAVVTNVVSTFATAAGATADLTADLAGAAGTGETFPVTGLGEQAGGLRGYLDPKAGTGQLVTLRWRVGATTWLLAVGAPGKVDEAGVRRLADLLVTRTLPVTPTPS